MKQEPLEEPESRPAADIHQLCAAALAHHRSGQLDDAKRLYQQILAIDPHHADGLHLLGVVFSQTQQQQAGADLIQKAISINPGVALYHFNLGNVLREQGHFEEAATCFRTALDLGPPSTEANNNLGVCYKALGQLEEAIDCYRRSLAINPAHAISHGNLGRALKDQGRLEEAVTCFRRAIDLDPNSSQAHNDLGAALDSLDRLDEAVACYRRAISLKPDYANAQNNLGVALEGLGHFDAAILCYQRAAALKPDFQAPHNNLGHVFQVQGQFDKAISAYETAIALGPDAARSYLGLSECRKFGEADRTLVSDIEKSLDQLQPLDEGRPLLHFALGKIFDDLGAYETAIGHFEAANRLEGRQKHFDAVEFTETVDWLIREFPQKAPRSSVQSDSELPLFIVGMPRSGTTLTEQILSRHSKIAAGGELRFWRQKSDWIKKASIDQLHPATRHNAIDDYLALLDGICGQALRVTDKMPVNFLFLGMLHALFPKARIIHCRRNPLDTALSLYFCHFARGSDFAYSRADIVHYYGQYRRMMAHWRDVLPADRFLEIDYEQLIAAPEQTSREVLTFCGLDWEAACLEPHKSGRAVSTASAWQVRQPIYGTSVERWRHYETWLGEFRALLS